MDVKLELADIQGTVLRARPMPYYGMYSLFRIDNPKNAQLLLRRLLPHITSAEDWHNPRENAWINVVFTYQGLKALGIDEEILKGFPVEFRQGMAARKNYLGDIGVSDPEHWDMAHGGNGFHIGILTMAGSKELLEAKLEIGRRAVNELAGVTSVSRLEVGIPATMREHFGFADGFSRPFIEGEGGEPLPGQGDPLKAGEFVLGYENELGVVATGPGPEEFWRNGTYVSIRKLYQDVALFRRYLQGQAQTKDEQEFVAAKMMGRWRSGCPLALSPQKDDPSVVGDKYKNNAFAYYDDDPDGKITPLGCHIRRVNPRDALKDSITNAKLHRVLRRGAAYGPLLPEGAMEDDGKNRGLVIAFINANPGRQFEFVQSQWVNDGDFISEGMRTDPVVGRRDFSDDYTYPAKPFRKKITGLPDFTATKGGEHTFLPGIGGLRWLIEHTKY
ncbi:MAG: peroxidase [Citrobacter freundii]|nr:MAG: peroxidase [Citrobacter freundii]